MKHIIESQQFSREFLAKLFKRTEELRTGALPSIPKPQQGGILATLFYEPSTRTRFSFEMAAFKLGLQVVTTENAKEFSSAAKGETLEDTIRVMSEYNPSVIVLRHYQTGAAERAAVVSTVPIINAGDGQGQHPTQALTDLYTIFQSRHSLDEIHVLIGGDLKHGRTVRSLAYLLGKFTDVQITFVAPPVLGIGDDIKEYLSRHNVQFTETASLLEALPKADAVYWTRIQKERLPEDLLSQYDKFQASYTIDRATLRHAKSTALILHPLPRLSEISTDVDQDPRAVYFKQAGNGLWIRTALLEWILDPNGQELSGEVQ